MTIKIVGGFKAEVQQTPPSGTVIPTNFQLKEELHENQKAPASFILFGAAALTLSAALTACGGSDSGDSAAGTISKTCARDGNYVSVTQDGCLTEFGKNTQTVACSRSNTLYVLTVTGWTHDKVVQSGSKTTSENAKFGFNEVVLRCS